MTPFRIIKEEKCPLCSHPVSSSSSESDFLSLSEHCVRVIENLVNSGNLINKGQCLDLSSKLTQTVRSIQNLVLHSGASTDLFRPALKDLYKILEKAKLLVNQCRSKDWIAASVFQIQNEKDFQVILLEVGLCYNAICEQGKGVNQKWKYQKDLRHSSTFMSAPAIDIQRDQEALNRKLQDVAAIGSRYHVRYCFMSRRLDLKQYLVRYLLVKLRCISEVSRNRGSDISSELLWIEDNEPFGTWGNSIDFLGAGSGGCSVYGTNWLGISCAKKLFHGVSLESLFLKEAGILAHLNYPHIVKLISCGNAHRKGNRFITMELMEMSLSDLISHQDNMPFSILVSMDIMMQIALGMCYLHSVGVAHRDLKPHNVVVNQLSSPHLMDQYSVKLVDFGMSKAKVQASKSASISIPGVGTTLYRAPEVHPMAHPDGKGKAIWFKADVYSFAVTCAQILSLQLPFQDIEMSKLYDELMNGARPNVPPACPDELVALLKTCWDTNPHSRPSFLDICTRLEMIKINLLRGESTTDAGFQDVGINSMSYKFVQRQLEEHFSMQGEQFDITTDDEVEVLRESTPKDIMEEE